MNGVSGKIIQTGESGAARTGYDNLTNVGEKRFGKINELLTFGCNRKISSGDISYSIELIRNKFISVDRNENELNLHGLPFQICVNLFFKYFHKGTSKNC